jgi:hypothetical protein
MKILFLPVSIIGGLIAGQLSKKMFDFYGAGSMTRTPPAPSTAGSSCLS